jgi:hypothetical protein
VAELLGLIGFPSFILVSLVVGVRLLALARRTGELPELAIGLNFVFAGACGYALLIVAESLRLLPEPYDRYASFCGVTAISIGAALVALFAQRVFRPGSGPARVLLAAACVWLALGVAGSWVLHVQATTAGLGGWLGRWGPNVGILGAYAWCTFESLAYHVRMRRRAALGFGEPLVANRLLLWGIGTGAIAAVALLHLAAQLAGHYELPESLVGVTSMFALATAISEWLAFFPPASYRKRFEASAV